MKQLSHQEVAKVVSRLGESEIVNLNVSLKSLIEPIAASLPQDPSSLVSLHVLCCNEYFLVTGATAGMISELGAHAESVRSDLG